MAPSHVLSHATAGAQAAKWDARVRGPAVTGLRNSGQRVREERLSSHLVMDGEDTIPKERQFLCKVVCGRFHPSCCLSSDEVIYGPIAVMAHAIERSFLTSQKGLFFMVSGPAGAGALVICPPPV